MTDQWILGVDCAVDPRNVGIALGRLGRSGLVLERVKLCSSQRTPVDVATELIGNRSPVLFAVDAPLGWPCRMAETLRSHQAGKSIDHDPNLLFRRETDRFVRQQIGIQPLDVGADRIARTALAALSFLADMASELNSAVPLAWSPRLEHPVQVVEVYPAATLGAHELRSFGYKKPEKADERASIIDGLRGLMCVRCGDCLLQENADALDAAVCVLAGGDFLKGCAPEPLDLELAQTEGWIWVRGVDGP